MNHLIYLTSILFTIAFVFYTKYQFEDMHTTWASAQRKWHPFGGFMRVLFFVGLAVEHFYPSTIWDLILAGVINIILWDILVNVIDLHMKWNYEGSTAATDKKLGRIKWYVYAGMLVSAAVAKILSLKKTKN